MNSQIKKYIASDKWNDWKWQEQNAIHSIDGLLEFFPNLDKLTKESIRKTKNKLRFKLTPYLLSLIQVNKVTENPLPNDPIWSQFVPSFEELDQMNLNISQYTENWEMPQEMVNPILQHKYLNRVNFRIQNSCLAYCMYCFEAKRVLDTLSSKESFKLKYFDESIDYIKHHPEIEEVVISGGEPLVLNNEKLRMIFSKIRDLKQIRAIRIQTRAFVHNPFRFDEELISLFKQFEVTAIAFHVSHPIEVSEDSVNVINKFGEFGCRTMLLSHIPLLKGINNDEKVLIELFMRLYTAKIKPYYLLHAMPDTVGAEKFRTSVQEGVLLLRQIKRNYSNPALPEYVIVHKKGKHTVPFEIEGTSEFKYRDGFIEFLNWKGEWCIYEDYQDNNLKLITNGITTTNNF